MASLAVVTQDKVRLPVARAIDNAITFMLLSISSRSVFFFFCQIRSTTKTKLCYDQNFNIFRGMCIGKPVYTYP